MEPMRRSVVVWLALAAMALAGCGKGAPPAVDARSTGGASCAADADCRLFDNYCTGCECLVLAKSEPEPKCAGPGVECVVAPCAGKKAACQAGRCAVTVP